ncbi:hypothetical protein [Vulcanisaeta sp. JCM 14467]|uniref:hypothetical protein n=1 Tax=Vulcanisaeta sp. JCM 14467 TaxID=1295370 RepID=UPI002091FD7D|nr:hypothetical protein [Vulcanisaeta sp. JCM 14467]
MAEKVLPPYPLEFIRMDSRIIVRARDGGTLLYVKDTTLGKANVKAGDILEV